MEFPEDHGPLLPISPYGASKLACEAMILRLLPHVWPDRPGLPVREEMMSAP